MASLLSGLDESMFEEAPSPVKSQRHRQASRASPSNSQKTAVRSGDVEVSSGSKPRRSPVRPVQTFGSPVRAEVIRVSPSRAKDFRPAPESHSSPNGKLHDHVAELLNSIGQNRKVQAETTVKLEASRSPRQAVDNGPKREEIPKAKPLQLFASTSSTTAIAPTSPPTSPVAAEAVPSTQDEYDMDWDLDALADIDEAALMKASETIVRDLRAR